MRQTLPSISDQVLSSISSVQKIQQTKACSGFIHGASLTPFTKVRVLADICLCRTRDGFPI